MMMKEEMERTERGFEHEMDRNFLEQKKNRNVISTI